MHPGQWPPLIQKRLDMDQKMKVGVVSLGCNKNLVDTETALGLLADHNFEITTEKEKADVLLVNTCGFIGPAKEESIDTIFDMAKYKEEGRCRLLIVTGCLAQRYARDLMEDIPEIDILLGVNQYAALPDAIEKALITGTRQMLTGDNHTYFEHRRVLATPDYSAYIRIGEGCSNRCTFCAIPLIRGNYHSRDEQAILDEVREMAGRGVKEHILVAQDTTRYGTDHGGHTTLPDLMDKVSRIEGVDWLRVLYCYPDETSEELLDLMASADNICPYLDIPVQHIHPDILRRMHRLGTSEDILRCVRQARERNLTLRTTLIVGFPGETEDQFRQLLDFVQEAEFDRLGAFAYSPEEGTPAARLPDQIPEEVKQERLDRLMNLQSAISLRKNQARVGKTEQILVTDVNPDERLALGRSRHEAPETDGEIVFRYPKDAPKIGSFVPVRLTQAQTYDLMGEMI